MLNELLTRLRFLLTRKVRCEVDEVLQSHLEQQIQINIAAWCSLLRRRNL